MKFTGDASRLPPQEQAVIFRVAAEVGVPATLLAALRLAENGGAGREFGVLSEDAATYEAQARIAAVSLRNNLLRFVGGKDAVKQAIDATTGLACAAFVEFMGRRWAPVGAENDPHNLNANWTGNVKRAYEGSGVTD